MQKYPILIVEFEKIVKHVIEVNDFYFLLNFEEFIIYVRDSNNDTIKNLAIYCFFVLIIYFV